MTKIIMLDSTDELPIWELSPELVKTDLKYGWAFKDSTNIEYEIRISYSPGQGGSTVWAVVLTEIDMGVGPLGLSFFQSKWVVGIFITPLGSVLGFF